MSRKSKDLLSIYRQLDDPSRETLQAFAEFLLDRTRCGSDQSEPVSTAPEHVEPPPDESVIAAIKRLRRSYPMLNTDSLFNETTVLMSGHIMGGHSATEVIGELEALFDKYYQLHKTPPGVKK